VAYRPNNSANDVAASLPDQWRPDVTSRAWQGIVLHHSATTSGSVTSIDADHRRRKDAAGNAWLGVAYHFVIGNGHGMDDGQVVPTFRWKQQLDGAHAGDRRQNALTIGICLVGDFDVQAPTARQLAALDRLGGALVQRYGIRRADVVRHQDIHATRCPGRLFPFETVVAPWFSQAQQPPTAHSSEHSLVPVFSD
jgi:N-acetyl-anhydromuramyl-L-alanine amidase AmpD